MNEDNLVSKEMRTMKARISFVLILLILTVPTFKAAESSKSENVVKFVDPNLEICIKSELNINSDFVTVNELSNLTSLTCNNQKISNLSGIENASNLTNLNLKNNDISDISSLSELTKLKRLDLSSNKLNSISELNNLTSLTSLKISNNQVQDIAVVGNLVNLERFEANLNQISDITPLSALNDLQYLQLSHNQITDISVVSQLTQLSQLLLDDNQISLIPSLSKLTQLKLLNLSSNDISQLTDIGNTQISTLDVSDNKLRSIKQLGNSETIKSLKLSNNKISDITGLNKLPQLEELDLSYNEIDEIDKIVANDNLVQINLRNNMIQDTAGFSSLSSLEELNLSQNEIQQPADFSSLSNLKRLNLSENRIIDLSNLEELDKVNVNAENQLVELAPKKVDIKQDVSYTIKGLSNESYPINFSIDEIGTKTYKMSWNSPRSNNYIFSGTVYQDITYLPEKLITGETQKHVDEEQSYSDQQLIKLFNVESILDQELTVDQSKVNYSKPGKYSVTFTDEDSNQLSTKLIVDDVLPNLTTASDTITIDSNTNIVDYLSLYSPTATEITTGDLNNKITIDDTAVNFEQPGNYNVKFKVRDEEGNLATKTVTLVNASPSNDIIISTTDPDISVVNGHVRVAKHSASGRNLAGFEYTIYDENGNIIEVIVTDKNGQAESDQLLPGHYYVEQTGVPGKASGSTSEENEVEYNSSTQNSVSGNPTRSTGSVASSPSQPTDGIQNSTNDSSGQKVEVGLKDTKTGASGSEVVVNSESETADIDDSSETKNNVFEKKTNKKKVIIALVFGILVIGFIFIFIEKVRRNG